MQQLELYHIGFLALAIVLEIVANIFLKMSNGFSRVWLGLLSLVSVLGAFSALAQAVKGIESFGGLCAVGRFRYCCHHRCRLDPVRSTAQCQRLDGAGPVIDGDGHHQTGLTAK